MNDKYDGVFEVFFIIIKENKCYNTKSIVKLTPKMVAQNLNIGISVDLIYQYELYVCLER